MTKRLFDLVVSAAGLLLLTPVFLAVALLIKLDSRGPVLFRQERIGKNFRPFRIFKFRTMSADAPAKGPAITVGGDSRVTGAGRLLRRTKLDELPQLINVVLGQMSLVGPRPEVPKYVELFRKDYELLLTVRPGITDPASIRYSDEESLLALSPEWEKDYQEKILPEKIRLAKGYLATRGFLTDAGLILRTLRKI